MMAETFRSLLPPSAVRPERAQEQATTESILTLDTDMVRKVKDPDTCPLHLLPWLAWEFAVDFWQDDWSEEQKRQILRDAAYVHQHRGTAGAVLRALGAVGVPAAIKEWWQDSPRKKPYTFRVELFLREGADSVLYSQVRALVIKAKNLRSGLSTIDVNTDTLKVATGDGLFLRQDRNLSDVEDRDESVENLGLKPTVDKAKNSVQRDGDNMTGELKIRGVNALRIFNDAFGLIFRRSEESLHLIPTQENQGENGDIGPLRPFSINLRTGEISMSHKVSVGGGSQVNGALGIGVQNALGGNSIAFGDNDTGLKQNGDGLLDVYANGQHVFRFQNGALQSNRAVNVSGRVTPTDYSNFDERYQTKTGGVQNFQYTSEVFYNPGGNELSWTFRAPPGCTLSGIVVQETGSSSADNIGGVYYKQAQIYINGAWRSVSG
ncbi:phage tail protein I [Escherichia coli]